jgi:ATP-dependent Clp protease ATP-binding subunit ClpC
MATTMCEIDGRRPAVASLRIRQNGEERTIAVCEEHLRELQGQSSGAGRLPFGGRSLFDEFFSDFFGDRGLGSRTPGAGGTITTRPRRPAEQIDVTQYFSDATRRLLQDAAQKAMEWGSLDVDSTHLLWAATQDEVVQHVLQQVGADAAAIAAQIEEEADVKERTDVAPSLSPDAKAALLAAYEESRQIGASYVGPEHVLLALAQDTETEAGELLERFAISHTKLRGAVIRGVESGWASRPWGQNSLDQMPAAVVGASIGQIGTALAQQSLRGVLSFCNARQMTAPEAYIRYSPEIFPGDGDVADASTKAFLTDYMEQFRTYIVRVLTVIPRN